MCVYRYFKQDIMLILRYKQVNRRYLYRICRVLRITNINIAYQTRNMQQIFDRRRISDMKSQSCFRFVSFLMISLLISYVPSDAVRKLQVQSELFESINCIMPLASVCDDPKMRYVHTCRSVITGKLLYGAAFVQMHRAIGIV